MCFYPRGCLGTARCTPRVSACPGHMHAGRCDTYAPVHTYLQAHSAQGSPAHCQRPGLA